MIVPVSTTLTTSLGSAAPGASGSSGNMSFSDYLGRALDEVSQVANRADNLAVAYASGGPVSTADLMIAETQASLAVGLLSQTATRVQQAYSTLMNMQI